MKIPTLKAETRTQRGTRFCRNLRESGRLPGVIYGHGEEPVSVSFSAHELKMELRHGSRLMSLEMGGEAKQYLIKEVQYDHFDKDPVHVDFARVDLDERVRVQVTVELRGTPAGLSEGGILDQLHDKIEVECRAGDIPSTLHPSVAGLLVNDALCAKDIELPEGVTLITGPDEKIAMVHILAVKADEATEEGAESTGSAEPERIGRVAEDPESKDA